MAEFEWDPEKESLNIRKHVVPLTTASLIWNGALYERPDNHRDYGESRFVAFGTAEGRVLAVVYTPRGEARRIISARRANAREKACYEAEIEGRGRSSPD